MLQDLVDAIPFFLEGAGVTMLYTIIGAVAALLVSFVFGLLSMSTHRVVRFLVRIVVEFFRGTSLVVQLLWIVFVLPQLGFRLDILAAATVALALNFGAYGSEVVRGALVSVPKAQWEATVALGLGRVHRMRRVILPQAVPEMIPPFSNLLVQILKSSSLLFLVGISELTFQVNNLRFDVGSLWAFGIALIVYFVLAQILLAGTRVLETRAARRVGRRPVAAAMVAPSAAPTAPADPAVAR